MVAPGPLDEASAERLITTVAAGERARSALMALVWEWLLTFVRSSQTMRARSRYEDEVHNVATLALGKIVEGLGSYPEWRRQHPDKTLSDWLRIVATNAVRSYLRQQLGPPDEAGDVTRKNVLAEWIELDAAREPSHRPPRTLTETARELAEYAAGHLPAIQLQALRAWLEGATFDEIADQLVVSDEDASRVVHSAIATLRRHFRDERR
jgi:DNA-directed RNA polymerase specialized sigma24 family protein